MTVQISRGWYIVLTLGIAAVAIALRLYPFRESFFPLNDGALFLAFVDHIKAGLYFSDPCVGYNGDCIPFAYPPLSFFLAASLSSLGLSSIGIGTVYPLALSILMMGPIFVLLREVTQNRMVQLLAFAAMLLQIRSIEYTLMGGGISRATGAFFFVLALLAACRMARDARGANLLFCGGAIGAAALSHLEWGINAALGATLLVLFCGTVPVRQKLRRVVAMGLISALVVTPWLIWALTTYGLAPFASASGTAGWDPSRIAGVLNLDFFPRMLGLVCAIGAGAMAVRGNIAWSLMLVAFYLATPRHFGSVAVFPAAVLAAYGVFTIVDQGLKHMGHVLPFARPALVTPAAVVCFVLGLAAIQLSGIQSRESFRQVSPGVLAAAAWAQQNFAAQARAVNLSPLPWYISREAEWWPYLTGHTSVNTVQGSEWLGRDVYRARAGLAASLVWSADCAKWLPSLRRLSDVDYVIANTPPDCLEQDPAFVQVFEAPGVRLYTVAR